MTIALLVMTDGRLDCLDQTIRSAREQLRGDITECWMHDDTGEQLHRDRLAALYPDFTQIGTGPRRGFGGAIAHAWQHLKDNSQAEWVFHLEGDFTVNSPIDLTEIARAMKRNPQLVQMALRRQAWSDAERTAGGVIEQHPDAYTDCTDQYGSQWLEHRLFYTTNPSLYRHGLCDLGWPDIPQSEGQFTHYLLREGDGYVLGSEVRFGYWGARQDQPLVEHIGDTRVGRGY